MSADRALITQLHACITAHQVWCKGAILAFWQAPVALAYAVDRGMREGLRPKPIDLPALPRRGKVRAPA